ncbi:Uncharacterised protein [Mycoplasmopsis maculosa]|uniref:Uncharacterized protein n=1 Tax=Mycoplasmopsis maculosa TaxID=114885 RepID=A0A449B3T8_9BACT|nr:hypothetical protein [Mycoplasmopsis maculosa]VEU75246.1 Uncharacterised protein [Mycoplasmopsis maculosa]
MLEQYGKNEALAKKIIEDLTDKNDTFSIKDAYEAYKSAKEAMQPADLLKAKEEAKKAIEAKISKILSASEDVISREQKEALVNELKKLEDNIENASKVKTVLDNLENAKSLYELPVSKVEADERFDNLIKEVETNPILTADQKTQIINDLKVAKAENSKATTKEAVKTNSESAEAKAREDIKNYEELENARAKAIEEINKYVELIKNDKSVSQRKLDELLKEAEKAIKQLENDKTLAEIKKTRDDFFNNYDIYNQKRPGLVIIALLLALSSVAAIVLLLLLLLDPEKK